MDSYNHLRICASTIVFNYCRTCSLAIYAKTRNSQSKPDIREQEVTALIEQLQKQLNYMI